MTLTAIGEYSNSKISLNVSIENLKKVINQKINTEHLKELRKPEFHDDIIKANLILVKSKISESVNTDTLIIQSINSIDELNKVCNTLIKRLREWFGYYFPELNHLIVDNEAFVKKMFQKSKEEFMKDHNIEVSMGPEFKEEDLQKIINLSKQIKDLYAQRDELLDYLDNTMKIHCPNVTHLIGASIGAKLIEKSGSLKNLALLPSSTIQLLGAEKALFRHIRNKKARCPKHGYILSHQFVINAKRSLRGKNARVLANKISIAAKVDYFKGEFIADKLKEELK